MKSYWERHLNESRLTRRRALTAIGGAAASGALLAACGGGDETGSADTSGLLSQPKDTTKQLKKGGTYKGIQDSDIAHWDPELQGASALFYKNRIYQKLLRGKPGYLEPAKAGEVEGDLATSWEYSSDGLQLTLKLRTDARWDERTPTSGRPVDAQDVLFTLRRMEAQSPRRSELFYSLSPDSSIVSMSAPDNQTIVIKLAEPNGDFIETLTSTNAGYFHLVPREAESASVLDLRTLPRGSGSWHVTEFQPSSRVVLKRSPWHYEKDFPYIDTWETPIVTEYAARMAQFRTGATYTEAVRAEDIIQTKRDVPELVMYAGNVATTPYRTMPGWQEKGTPFRDERVRQAYALAQDRDLFIDTFYNVSKFKSEGLPVETRWNTAIWGSAEGWWLDPQGKDFGPNAKYYDYNLNEAKKLLTAAGYPNGFEVNAYHITTNDYGATFVKQIEVIEGMVREAGMILNSVAVGFITDWRPKYYYAKGNFDGVAINFPSGPIGYGGQIFAVYNSKGSAFGGFDPEGRGTFAGDPYIQDITSKIVREFDLKKRHGYAHDLQRYEAKTQYYHLFPGGSAGFVLGWPVVGNYRVYDGHDSITSKFLWLDDSKPPLKRA